MSSMFRGDSFDMTYSLDCRINGVRRMDFTDWLARAQLRLEADGSLIAELDTIWVFAAYGILRLRSQNLTIDWPLGFMRYDVELTAPTGRIISTRANRILIEEDQTHD